MVAGEWISAQGSSAGSQLASPLCLGWPEVSLSFALKSALKDGLEVPAG